MLGVLVPQRQCVRTRGRRSVSTATRIRVLRAVAVDRHALEASLALGMPATRPVRSARLAVLRALAERLALRRGRGRLEGRGALKKLDRLLHSLDLRLAVLLPALVVRLDKRAARLDRLQVRNDRIAILGGGGKVLHRLLVLLLRVGKVELIARDRLLELLLRRRQRLHLALELALRRLLRVDHVRLLVLRRRLDELEHLDRLVTRLALAGGELRVR